MHNLPDSPSRMHARKNDHIRLCATENVESSGAPFSEVRLVPEALPQFSLGEVDTRTSFLGAPCALPLLITGMTGGVESGQEINSVLARAAQACGIPMGLGSQKIMLSRPETRALFDVRAAAPDVFLIGNIGVGSGNYGVTEFHIQSLVDSLGLNAFALHLNALQECVQPEGERDFSNTLRFVERVARRLSVPILVKEVGSGLSAETFRRLIDAGAAAVDVGGRGGTSWSVIEGLRSPPRGRRLGELFRNWGFTTEESLRACMEVSQEHPRARGIPIVATGGIRDGVQVAKAVALGATLCGVGLPLFRAAVAPPEGCTPLEAVLEELHFFQDSLKIALFCSGARTLSQLPERLLQRTHP
ncbi:MAG: type 2 isopentenyl-diphosphate Delta-isomerase [Silvanigrellales bacterium]|nr:type 2 isopentenyl-diphosphate Delta-isomerase [Silvanigrellales bacterium]